jgi:hypothetical protein
LLPLLLLDKELAHMLSLLLLLPFLLLVMDLLVIGLALMLLMLAMALKVDHQNNHLLDRDQPLSQQLNRLVYLSL